MYTANVGGTVFSASMGSCIQQSSALMLQTSGCLPPCRDAPSRPWDDGPDSPVARNSPFGEGSTLLREAQVGPIGKFHRALLSLGPTVNLDHFHLPKLICLGNQSTGTKHLQHIVNRSRNVLLPLSSSVTTSMATGAVKLKNIPLS